MSACSSRCLPRERGGRLGASLSKAKSQRSLVTCSSHLPSLAYAGLYDQQFRKDMTEDWLQHLALSGIACKAHNPITEYLSNADERLAWQRYTLPVDDLCTENAIILKRFNRYPLIIDPSNRATEFLRQENHSRKLTVTSFLDETFVKQLESALRFGNPILIQDAEHLDPILTHVLKQGVPEDRRQSTHSPWKARDWTSRLLSDCIFLPEILLPSSPQMSVAERRSSTLLLHEAVSERSL